jgi:hypothetical protein
MHVRKLLLDAMTPRGNPAHPVKPNNNVVRLSFPECHLTDSADRSLVHQLYCDDVYFDPE